MTGRPDVSLLTTAHDVADARLHRLAAALVDAGLVVEVLGLGDPADGPPLCRVQTAPASGRARRAARAVTLPGKAQGQVLVVLDPELVVPALVARHRYGRRVVADVHEDYLALLADRSWARGLRGAVARGVARQAVRAAARADLTSVVDEHVPPAGAVDRLVVPNVPLASVIGDRQPMEARPRAVYVGDVRRSRGLHHMLAAVEGAPAWRLDVVGPVAPADAPWCDEWQRTSAARARVRFHGRLPPREAWHVAAGAWAGLCLLEDTPAFRPAMPTKVYEYMAAGLAVLTSPLPRPAGLVRTTSAGVVAEGAAHVSAILRDWAGDPALVRRYGSAGLNWAERELSPPGRYDEFARRVRALTTTEHV